MNSTSDPNHWSQQTSSREFLATYHKLLTQLQSLEIPNGQWVATEFIKSSYGDEILMNGWIERLKKDEPVEYILGYTDFCDLRLAVNRTVLIPRVETEMLVELAVIEIERFLDANDEVDSINVVDVGCGSGAILLSVYEKIRLRKEKINFYGVELSRGALETATHNRDYLYPEAKNIILQKSDLLSQLSLDSETPTFLLANLPYIPDSHYPTLDLSVRDYEPKEALISGGDGLDLYRELIKQATKISTPFRIFEIDPSQSGFFIDLGYEIVIDTFGLERFVTKHQ